VKKKKMKNEKNAWKSITVIAIVLTVLGIAVVGSASAKSLYVIADINADPTPIQAYDIQGNILVYQATHNVPYYGWGAVGLSIDTDSETLFVTYEESNTIQLLDAKTFADLGTTTAPGASNLAGIVVDQDKGLVYTIDRYTDNLYVYTWDPSTHTLTLQSSLDLPNAVGLYGIALDEVNDRLYVADGDAPDGGRVRYYDTATWTEQGNFKVCHSPIGIAVDVSSQTVYTVAGFRYSDLLSKYELATGTETTVDMGHGGMGVAVDPATGLVSVSGGYAGDDVSVWDPSTLTQTYTTGDIGDPTGICIPGKEIGYNPLDLSKDDGLAEGECVKAGANINYKICYDNTLNTYDVHSVTITDTLPAETTFVSASDGGTYDSSTHTVTWDIGTLPAGTPQDCVTLIVTVKSGTAPETLITNSVTIDSDETPPTTQNEDTNVCGGPTPCIPCVSIEVDVSINKNSYTFGDIFNYTVSVTNNQAYKPGKSRIAITYGLIDPTPKTITIGTHMPDIYLNDAYSFSADFMVPYDVYSGNYVFFASAFDMETGCCGCNAVPYSVERLPWGISATSKEESSEPWLEIVEK
jgi:uncharacterized repeat protein (TIGR01451 family)